MKSFQVKKQKQRHVVTNLPMGVFTTLEEAEKAGRDTVNKTPCFMSNAGKIMLDYIGMYLSVKMAHTITKCIKVHHMAKNHMIPILNVTTY